MELSLCHAFHLSISGYNPNQTASLPLAMEQKLALYSLAAAVGGGAGRSGAAGQALKEWEPSLSPLLEFNSLS